MADAWILIVESITGDGPEGLSERIVEGIGQTPISEVESMLRASGLRLVQFRRLEEQEPQVVPPVQLGQGEYTREWPSGYTAHEHRVALDKLRRDVDEQ